MIALFEAGNLEKLESASRQLIAEFPADAFIWKVHGTALAKLNREAEALAALEKAQALDPQDAEIHNTLGYVLRCLDRPDDAIAAFRKAVECNPAYAEAHFNLGGMLQRLGHPSEAAAAYRRSLDLDPRSADAHCRLADLLREQGRLLDAELAYRCVLAINPNHIEALNNLGTLLPRLGKLNDARCQFEHLLSIAPQLAEAHNNLGNVLQDMRQPEQAAASFRRAIELDSNLHDAHANLGQVLYEIGDLDAAERCLRHAIQLSRDNAKAHFSLGRLQENAGKYEDALDNYDRALQIPGTATIVLSNALFSLAYSGLVDPLRYREYAARWEQVALSPEERHRARRQVLTLRPRTARLLRIGLLSAELGEHPVAHFLQSWLPHLDRSRFSLTMYPTNIRGEPQVEQFRALADHWMSLVGLSDEQAAARIRDDQIDILIDTSGHTAFNRLGVIAYRAAPVQCHYIGYFATTGLSEMDWFIGDATLLPPGLDEFFTERVWRLPRPWLAYAPPGEAPLPRWQPSQDTTLCLGSFNNLDKLDVKTLELWARVLVALPRAQMLLKQSKRLRCDSQRRILNTLATHGVAPGRVHFNEPTSSWYEHMAHYERLDIALDTLPTNSGTTAFEALWMGVPLVTLTGQAMGARMGTAILSAIGRDEWIAQTPEEYVTQVVALAQDRDQRRAARLELRDQMRGSPLCDGVGLARALSDAFEQMFDLCVAKQSLPSIQGRSLAVASADVAKTTEAGAGDFNVTSNPLSRGASGARPGSPKYDQASLMALWAKGPLAELERAARHAVNQVPEDAFARKIHGGALMRLGRTEEARSTLEKALALNDEDGDTYNLYGCVLNYLGQQQDALTAFSRAISLLPTEASAFYNRANLHSDLAQWQEAEADYRKALDLKPGYTLAAIGLSHVFSSTGCLAEAEQCLAEAIVKEPNSIDALNLRGQVLIQLKRPADAEDCYQRALQIDATNLSVLCNLGDLFCVWARLEDAERALSRAIQIDERYGRAYHGLGQVLHAQGRLPEAVERYRHALAIDPNNQGAYSALLFTLNYSGYQDPANLRREAEGWERAVLSAAERAAARGQTFSRPARAGRALRVGLLSAELGVHAVAMFLHSWLQPLDRQRVQVVMYPTLARPDAETAALRALADAWVPLIGLSDEAAAARIRADGIDILIDTSGHTANNRLGVIARRAAPVQCHYIGYFGTTGLSEMDWLLADAVLLPPACDGDFVERIWRLPRLWVAYEGPETAPLPAWQPDPTGTLWLGSFNNLNKVGEPSLRLWAKILLALPEAKLVLKDAKALDAANQARLRATLAHEGIAPQRLVFSGHTETWQEHMAQYDRLDIALDPLPMNSGTTAFEALWMGVPLITLAGNTLGGRMGAAILTALGRAEWIAHTPEQYVAKVVALARAVEPRRALRSQQREQIRRSPLVDGRGLAAALMDAFEQMFDLWWQRQQQAQIAAIPAVPAPSQPSSPSLPMAQALTGPSADRTAVRQSTANRTVDQVLLEALQRHQVGDLATAHALYLDALQLQPANAEANHFLGVLLLQAERPREALLWLRRALERDSAQEAFWLPYLDALVRAGQYDMARETIDRARRHGLCGHEIDAIAMVLDECATAGAADGSHSAATGLVIRSTEQTEPPAAVPAQQGASKRRVKAKRHSKSGSGSHLSQALDPDVRQRLLTLLAQERFAELERATRHIVAATPYQPFAWQLLAIALANQSQDTAALDAIDEAIRRDPQDADSRNIQGGLLLGLGRYAEAVDTLAAALAIAPTHAKAHYNQATAYHHLGQTAAAEAGYRRAIENNPRYAQAHNNLGNLLLAHGRLPEAEQSFRRAIACDPRLTDAYVNLGNALDEMNQLPEAIATYQQALALNPNDARAHCNLGVALRNANRLAESAQVYRQALALRPDDADTIGNLAWTLHSQGCFQEAVAHYRRALALAPDNGRIYSSLLFTLGCTDLLTPAAQRREAEGWEQTVLNDAERHAARQQRFSRHAVGTDRTLRLGILSAELGRHPVAHFLHPWLRALDRRRISLHMYPTKYRPESETAALRALADSWTPLIGLSDADAVARIRADQIDVLLETSGHTADHRLGVIARRAAPVQCHYIGFFGTTGLTEMDWFIADAHLVPPELDDLFTERVWRLPRPWLVYDIPSNAPEPTRDPDEDGVLWLGSFNNLVKVGERTLGLWAKVLHALPKAKLMLKDGKATEPQTQDRILTFFDDAGIPASRIRFVGMSATWVEHMAHYNQLDIALETLPLNSGTTAFDALWMGVPLVTLAGDRMGGRMGMAILEGIGQSAWIARDDDEYVAIVARLAGAGRQGAAARRAQRERVRASALCDGEGMARALEQAFSAMLQQADATPWTAGNPMPATLSTAVGPLERRSVTLSAACTLSYLALDAGRAVTAILIHGALCSAESLSHLAPACTPYANLIIPDLRGHGFSTAGPEPWTLPVLASDIQHILDAERVGDVVIIGESFGALVAAQLAQQIPEQTQLVICSEPPLVPARLDEVRQAILAAYRAGARQTGQGLCQVLGYACEAGQNPKAIAMHSLIGAIAAPTILLHGTAGEGARRTVIDSQDLRRMAPYGSIKVHAVDRADHLVLRTHGAELLPGWLGSLSRPPRDSAIADGVKS